MGGYGTIYLFCWPQWDKIIWVLYNLQINILLDFFSKLYTQYRNIRNNGFFPVLDCFLNFLFFQYSGFLPLQGRFLNFSRSLPLFLKFSRKKKNCKKNCKKKIAKKSSSILSNTTNYLDFLVGLAKKDTFIKKNFSCQQRTICLKEFCSFLT